MRGLDAPCFLDSFFSTPKKAPKYTGKNVINPLAAILSGAMMLDYLGEKAAAKAIEKSVAYLTEHKIKSLSAGKMGYSTTEVGDLVVKNLK